MMTVRFIAILSNPPKSLKQKNEKNESSQLMFVHRWRLTLRNNSFVQARWLELSKQKWIWIKKKWKWNKSHPLCVTWNWTSLCRTEDRCPDIHPPTTLRYFNFYCIFSLANGGIFVSFSFSRLLFQPFMNIPQTLSPNRCFICILIKSFDKIRERRYEERQEGGNVGERGAKPMNDLAGVSLDSWAPSRWNATWMLPPHHMTPARHRRRNNWNELTDNEKSSLTGLQQLG